MSSAKTEIFFALLAKLEASYNAGGSVSPSTDGILLAELPQFQPSYANDGGRPAPPATYGTQKRAKPSGRFGSFTAKLEPRGVGSAISSSNLPAFNALLRASGFDLTVDATPGSEKATYAPAGPASALASLVAEGYTRAQKWPLQAGYADFSASADGDTIPMFEFAIQALLGLPTDVALPAVTYTSQEAVDPPKSVGAGLLTLGNATGLILRKWGLKMGRQIGGRVNQNTAAGHAGFTPGRHTPTLSLTVEATARAGSPYTATSTLEPDLLYENATSLAWAIQWGATQYNKFKLYGPAAQIMAAPKDANDGATALWELELALNASSVSGSDSVKLDVF